MGGKTSKWVTAVWYLIQFYRSTECSISDIYFRLRYTIKGTGWRHQSLLVSFPWLKAPNLIKCICLRWKMPLFMSLSLFLETFFFNLLLSGNWTLPHWKLCSIWSLPQPLPTRIFIKSMIQNLREVFQHSKSNFRLAYLTNLQTTVICLNNVYVGNAWNKM